MQYTKLVILLLILLLLFNTPSQTLAEGIVVDNTTQASSGRDYLWQLSLAQGSLQYTDRIFTFTQVPAPYLGLQYLRTANEDKASSGASFLSFDVNQEVTVYVAHDDRINTKPIWLSSFTDTGDNLLSGGGTFSLYAKDYSSGIVTLGGNSGIADASSMYTVVVKAGASGGPRTTAVSLSNSRYFAYNNAPLMILGDSATQSVLQNANIDYQAWIDELSSQGVKSAMAWAWMAPRQKIDGSVKEARYGYVVPEVMPWQRTGTGTANDGKPAYDLGQFNPAYFERVKGLCSCMQSKGMVLLLSVWDGGAKWANGYHPFWGPNGGPIPDTISGTTEEFRNAFYTFDDYSASILDQAFDPNWSWQKKNKYFQEKFADKLVSEISSSCNNVIYEITNEGAQVSGYDDFWLNFFKARTSAPLSVNLGYTAANSDTNDNVGFRTWHSGSYNPSSINSSAENYFNRTPHKPIINSETVPAFTGGGSPSLDEARMLLWASALGGGGAFIQDDTVFADYDPNVADTNGRQFRTYLGYINKFFNDGTDSIKGAKPNFWEMLPANSLVTSGYALSKSGFEYIVYLPSGGSTTLDLSAATGTFDVSWYNPRDGSLPTSAGTISAGGSQTFTAPDTQDWVVHLTLSGIPGDVNADHQVNVLDIQACVNHILGGRPEPGNNPDVNGDGSVNVLDVQNIVNIILGV